MADRRCHRRGVGTVTRVIGVDHGTRRIGLAVGDTETGMAFERDALRPRSLADAVDGVARLAHEEGAVTVIVGLPLHMDGTEGVQAAAARAFGAALERIGLTVAYEDERLSSWEAREGRSGALTRDQRRSGAVDSASARVILQQYLDALRSRGRLEET